MILVHASRNAYDGPSGIRIPVRSAKTRKRRDYITAIRILDLLSHILGILRRINQAHLVPKPLDGSPCCKNRAFQSIADLSALSPGNSSDQTIIGKHRLLSCVHKQKASGSVSIFCFSRL